MGYNIPKELYRFEKVEINKDSLKEDLIKVRLIFNNNVANHEFAYNEDIRSYEVTNIDNGTQFKNNTEHNYDTNVGVDKGVDKGVGGKGGLSGKSVDHLSSFGCSCKCCN